MGHVTPALLEATGLTHRFGRLLVLDGVSLRIPAGRLLVTLGPNGAGKTTLLRVLSGVVRPTAGRVEVDGLPLESLPRREIARRMAVVPQESVIPFPFRVEEIVAMGRAPHVGALGREGSHDREAVTRAMDSLGLEPLATRPFGTLSAGERQRVLLARALSQDTALLLLDEPTAHMDLGHRLFVFEHLRSWIDDAPSRRSALVVTHDLALAARFAEEIVLLHEGRIVASGAPSEVLHPDRIGPVFGADVELVRDCENRPHVVALRSRIRYSARSDGPDR